ncbi:hypothetical protein BH23THE1_BH23THE1_17360 [soil metagenome]
MPADTFLIIRQFDKAQPTYSRSIHSLKTISSITIAQKIVIAKLQQLGIREKNYSTTELMTRSQSAKIRHELHPCHSFRIFAVTQMQRSKVDKTIREMLVGHSTGLDSVYYKPQEEEILQEYLKAVDLLTINNENRLRQKIDELNGKNDVNQNVITSKLQEKDDQIQLLIKKQEQFELMIQALIDSGQIKPAA